MCLCLTQAFEDNYDIENILRDGGVLYGALEQRWTTECAARLCARNSRSVLTRAPCSDAVNVIASYAPDVLLLDFYIPPLNGLQVLTALNAAVAAGTLPRPRFVLGMSSVDSKNRTLISAGADEAFNKWDVHRWHGWARNNSGER